MRGESITKRPRALASLLSGLLLATAFSGCGFPFKDKDEEAQLQSYTGHAAVRWTLNSALLTAETCKTERITSMNVFVASRTDRDQNVEFINTTCGLDRFS